MSDTDAKILDHEYDGIREYDNPLPQWWTWIMWGTVIFSVPYFLYYTFGVGETLEQSYDSEAAAFFEVLAKRLGNVKPDEATLLRLSRDDTFMATGRVLFRANCAVCHSADGGGGTGPNMTDDHYINVKKVEDLYTTIHDGVVNKGMPAWSRTFGEPHMVVLAAYAASLRGTKPAAPKAPQGDAIAPWPTATTPADTSPESPDALKPPMSSGAAKGSEPASNASRG